MPIRGGHEAIDHWCDPSAFTMPDAHGPRVVPGVDRVPRTGRHTAASLQVNMQVSRYRRRLFTGGEQLNDGGVPCHSTRRGAGAGGGIVEE